MRALILAACLAWASLAPAAPDFQTAFCKAAAGAPPEQARLRSELGRPSADLGLRLLRELEKKDPGASLVSSPYGIGTTLLMALAGARGQTAEEIAQGLALKGVPTGAALKLQAWLSHYVDCPSPRGSTEIRLANRLFVQKGEALEPAYLKTLKEAYDAAVGEVDYRKAAESARNEINAWVERMTAGRIKGLLPPRALTAASRLTLVNALYVKGAWAAPFDPAATKAGDFTVAKGAKVSVPMMHLRAGERDVRLSVRPGFRALEMPFEDRSYAVVVLLPDAVDGLAAVEAALTGEEIEATLADFAYRRVNLTLPKFRVESSFDLVDALCALGMKAMLDPRRADFTGIDAGRNRLFVSAAMHKAYLDVSETGLEAAAATAMGMMAGGMPPKPSEPVAFVVDRPFLVVLVEPHSGTVLFLGRVTKP